MLTFNLISPSLNFNRMSLFSYFHLLFREFHEIKVRGVNGFTDLQNMCKVVYYLTSMY